MSDTISRQAAIDAPENFIKDCNPDHFVGHQKFIEFMDNAEIGSFGNWQFVNGFNMGLTAAEVAIKNLPSVQPEPRWISCEERLPIKEFEDGRKNRTVYDLYPCLVTRYSTHTDEPRTRTYVCKSYFDGEDFMLHGGYAPNEGSDTENTLAWMPLPEPYEGGGE